MIRQPRYREHYGRTAEQVADEALRMIRHRSKRIAIFVYADGETQTCDGFGERFVRRCAIFGRELVGVYGVEAERAQIVDDILASTYGHRLRAEPRTRPASGARCAVGR